MTQAEADEQLTGTGVAALMGIKVDSFRSERSRGIILPPDGYVGVTPWWWKSRVLAWLAAGRPTQVESMPH